MVNRPCGLRKEDVQGRNAASVARCAPGLESSPHRRCNMVRRRCSVVPRFAHVVALVGATVVAAAVSLHPSAAQPAAGSTVITGVRLIDGTGRPPIENAV